MANNNNNEEVSKILVLEEGGGDVFNPSDMHVLAIDANIVCLKYLVVLLQKCQYRVTSTTIAAEALKILRENKNDYHIVITDVKRLDMDGFKLLEIIGLEMDLPVIMVSAEDSTSSIMKGIRHGARGYLLKPVRLQEIKNIWQHVIRKRFSDSSDKSSSITKEITEQESAMPLYEPKADVIEVEEREIIGEPNGDPSSAKKPRVTWSSELHKKFVDCFQLLEAKGERVHPKRIREMMNEDSLSRENIASHLQKYRNLLKKHKEKMNQQDSLGIGMNKHGGISDTKNGLWNNARDFTLTLQSPPSSSLIDSKRMFSQPRNHNFFQDNSLSRDMVRQQRMLNHGEGNSSSTTLAMSNPIQVPEFKGLDFSASSSTWRLPTNYMGSQFFRGDPGPCNISHFSFSPAVSFNPSFPVLGHTKIETSPASVLSSPNSFPGRHEGGGISKNLHGSGTSNFREHDRQCAYGNQKPVLIDYMKNEEAKLHMDEEISEMVKQFNNDAVPRL